MMRGVWPVELRAATGVGQDTKDAPQACKKQPGAGLLVLASGVGSWLQTPFSGIIQTNYFCR